LSRTTWRTRLAASSRVVEQARAKLEPKSLRKVVAEYIDGRPSVHADARAWPGSPEVAGSVPHTADEQWAVKVSARGDPVAADTSGLAREATGKERRSPADRPVLRTQPGRDSETKSV
jgi:hypothetical protein